MFNWKIFLLELQNSKLNYLKQWWALAAPELSLTCSDIFKKSNNFVVLWKIIAWIMDYLQVQMISGEYDREKKGLLHMLQSISLKLCFVTNFKSTDYFILSLKNWNDPVWFMCNLHFQSDYYQDTIFTIKWWSFSSQRI